MLGLRGWQGRVRRSGLKSAHCGTQRPKWIETAGRNQVLLRGAKPRPANPTPKELFQFGVPRPGP